ncbi:hypothetical protein [Gryllotalpicola kribbensis]|uniref:hypothetical protein n=1 Tax=Gryllotalpicola kribbensis TaxID=993084 RepID=UPI0031D6E478
MEDEYWKLIGEGVGTVEACKLVGIGRKTGYRWRAERNGVAPERQPEQVHSSRYLSLLDRQRIATLKARDLSIRVAEHWEVIEPAGFFAAVSGEDA